MTSKTLRIWIRVHTWTSLLPMLVLLLLCVTGLPLIFHEDIDRAFGQRGIPDPSATATMPHLPLDRLMEIASQARSGEAVRFATPVPGEPLWNMAMGSSVESRKLTAIVTVDARTGKVMRTGDRLRSPAMQFLRDLHSELLLDDKGMWILAIVGVCFVASIVSGVVVYAPFMRRLDFGTVRKTSRRLYWLDLHNLGGIVLTVWLLAVGLTGVVNTLSLQIANHWAATELAEMIRPWRNTPVPAKIISAQSAAETALAAAPGMTINTVAMPGTMMAGGHHYDVFLSGNQPLTSKLIMPVLINAEDGSISDMRSLPWYAQVLFLSKPLHFGDYGGMSLKILWALLDLAAIMVLGSGLYLWLARIRRPQAASQTSEVQHAPGR
ncbi:MULTISPECIES: PepSY-associated TM helix domain-containing protein [unclassified Beijerinckia]|uniref:PepSY-associated TM helix domain-containing protein n=1 Tax=unclassified Beijerinckia TaxID=2638183 RepID=UPI00089BE475|nr:MULTISPECIES: PepSY-associated TM helix domain-containing protein [unclassified Beijerinckia]MDH7794848.1 putative iron-regulated membrane protein [Beijerinckia sp. GAS462]SEB77635.1 Uncharacterized iron-regulated membrane protein [Beijerinckia sp. 28-YEA-48]